MEDFNIKQFLTENKMTRNSRLLSEETTMDRLEAHAGFDVEDGITTSDQGFVFDNKGDKLSTALVYTDYGSDREEGERALDPLVDELEKQLENAGAEYKITTTGRAYLVDIMIKNLDGTYLDEDEQLSLFPDDEPTEPTPEPLESNIEMVKDDYLARKEELDAMGSEKNKYAQQFAKWAKTKIKDIGFADRTMVSYELEKLFGLSKYSGFPLPDGRKENFLSVDVLEAWKSSNDPKYLGLLVYMDRILSPRKY